MLGIPRASEGQNGSGVSPECGKAADYGYFRAGEALAVGPNMSNLWGWCVPGWAGAYATAGACWPDRRTHVPSR